jgi:broad specificity phosphatase PhoE
MKETILYVVRHGETSHNRDDILSGHVNPELTEKGIKQATTVRKKMSHVHFDEVYSSDLRRAVNTASIVYGETVPTDHQLYDLRERNYGKIDGMHNDHFRNLRSKHEPVYDTLSTEKKWKYKYAQDIESDHELSERFVGMIEKIAKDNLGKTILIGAHSGSLRIMLVTLGYATSLELPPGGVFENGGFVKLIYDGKSFRIAQVEGLKKGLPLRKDN